ncbi:MAG: polymerase sigma-70 factor, sigma-E family protein [Acidimicrobiales bacterium]|jgi:RNA polymerase sigma-70 factor (sigma-E family)|nr:polymerase sigma-70 factor, sigma-E family protein [Acidimicrobiales bacterium]
MMTAEMGATQPPVWDDPLIELYRERYGPMVRLAYLLTSDRAVAEELVQDAFVNLHRNWKRTTNPAAYLRTSVVNATRSWGRRRTLEIHRRPTPPDPTLMVADEMWDTLQVLPMRQRAAIVLRFYEDLPDARIAEMLGCREATVRTAIHRGLARLRKEIEQ